jgi:non-ribosomal peptide synthetase component F
LEYRPDVVDQARAQRLLDRFRLAMLGLVDAGATIASVSLALPEECQADLTQAAATRHDLPDATVMDLLADQDADAVGLTALVCGDDAIDHAQLQERLNRLAWVLRGRGIGPECTVALAIPRSIDAVVALFAVLRAGAAYLPLELDYPDERLAAMLDDALPVCVLTTTATASRISECSAVIAAFRCKAAECRGYRAVRQPQAATSVRSLRAGAVGALSRAARGCRRCCVTSTTPPGETS